VPAKHLLVTAALLLACFFASAVSCSASEKPVIHFGVNLRYDPIVMYEHYQPMMDYLTSNTPYRFELLISRGYEEGVHHLVEGKSQIASLGDGGVLGAILSHGAVPILKPLNQKGQPVFRSFIVVAEHSKIRSLSDLKGKRVALGYHHSLTGNLIARKMLAAQGIPTGSLAALENLHKHSSVAKAVLKGEYDAGILKDVVAEGYERKGLRIIASSEEFPSTPLVARRGTPPEVIKAVTQALVKLDWRNPEHRKMLELWDSEYRYGFVPAGGADYRNLLRMYRAIPYGCGTGCHK
jgi:phosphonate transport system substrate-binding protein